MQLSFKDITQEHKGQTPERQNQWYADFGFLYMYCMHLWAKQTENTDRSISNN